MLIVDKPYNSSDNDFFLDVCTGLLFYFRIRHYHKTNVVKYSILSLAIIRENEKL